MPETKLEPGGGGGWGGGWMENVQVAAKSTMKHLEDTKLSP